MVRSLKLNDPSHEIHVSCDDYSFNYLDGNFKNVVCYKNDRLTEGNHVKNSEVENANFIENINQKFEHSINLLKKFDGPIIWCDVDHIFLNPIDENIKSLSKIVDACISPHSTNNFNNEAVVGFFNCGFAIIKSLAFLEHWYEIYKNISISGLYFEQKPLEIAARRFVTCNLPINYNIGWWRFVHPHPENHGKNLQFLDGKILFYGLDVVNFHIHICNNDIHSVNTTHVSNAILKALQYRGKSSDIELLHYIGWIKNESI
jgi:hypothetical protein